MDEPHDPAATPWTAAPTAKEKNAVQRAVTALLDELAPEKVLKRGDRLRGPVEQHRTPNGCVLQAQSAALSVSWFADASEDAPMGLLHIHVWRGVVSRRGAPPRAEPATIESSLVLQPVGRVGDDCVWSAGDGARYDTAALTAHCLALLEDVMKVTERGGVSS